MKVYELITTERTAQDEVYGPAPNRSMQPDMVWLSVLQEEVLEVGQEVIGNYKEWVMSDTAELESELIQVAAVCVAWMEAIWARK